MSQLLQFSLVVNCNDVLVQGKARANTLHQAFEKYGEIVTIMIMELSGYY